MTDVAPRFGKDPFGASLVGRRLGRYEVLAQLATGGMASVYVARAVGVAGFERLFAVKALHAHLAHETEFIEMFLEEARLAARIRHPNVVPTTDISDTADAGYYLVMDYVEGDHLGAILQQAHATGARIEAPVALRIVIDALQGLAAAHALTDADGTPLEIVHRDVSPHNVMVGANGIARLTDFGVAMTASRFDGSQSGQFQGKLAYMAPEHAARGDADQRSDLFSMAVVLWETLTGKRLFRAENQAATLNRVCLEPIPMPSEVDASLAPFDALLCKGLAREPSERFQSADEFADTLEANAEALGGVASQRTVARVVQQHAGEKIARDRELIASAIASLGTAASAASAMDALPDPSDDATPTSPSARSLSLASQPSARATPAHALGQLGMGHERAHQTTPAVPTRNFGADLAPPPPEPADVYGTAPDEEMAQEQTRRSRLPFWLAAAVVLVGGGFAARYLIGGHATSEPPGAGAVVTEASAVTGTYEDAPAIATEKATERATEEASEKGDAENGTPPAPIEEPPTNATGDGASSEPNDQATLAAEREAKRRRTAWRRRRAERTRDTLREPQAAARETSPSSAQQAGEGTTPDATAGRGLAPKQASPPEPPRAPPAAADEDDLLLNPYIN